MRVTELAEEVFENFMDICSFTFCDECSYNKVAPSCVIWYAYDYLSNNGYLRGAELDRDQVCNAYFLSSDHEDWLGIDLNSNFIKYLNRCGYLKGVAE